MLQSYTVFFQEASPSSSVRAPSDIPVLLLHGAWSDSQVWTRHKTIGMLAAMGYRVTAIDLPGNQLTHHVLANTLHILYAYEIFQRLWKSVIAKFLLMEMVQMFGVFCVL